MVVARSAEEDVVGGAAEGLEEAVRLRRPIEEQGLADAERDSFDDEPLSGGDIIVGAGQRIGVGVAREIAELDLAAAEQPDLLDRGQKAEIARQVVIALEDEDVATEPPSKLSAPAQAAPK